MLSSIRLRNPEQHNKKESAFRLLNFLIDYFINAMPDMGIGSSSISLEITPDISASPMQFTILKDLFLAPFMMSVSCIDAFTATQFSVATVMTGEVNDVITELSPRVLQAQL